MGDNVTEMIIVNNQNDQPLCDAVFDVADLRVL